MHKIILHSQDHLHLINQEDIVFCKSDNCYTYIHQHSDDELLISKSLAKFSKELDSGKFIRVNQSYLINIDYIKSVDKKKKQIEMYDRSRIHFTIPIKALLILLEFEGLVP